MAVTGITISITQNSQSVSNNTSNVTVSVVASWNYGSWNHEGTANGWIKIDGTTYNFSPIILNPNNVTNGSQTIMTKTVNVGHNSDGTKTLSCSASFYTGLDSSGTKTASASKTLTTIARKSSMSASNGTLGTAQTLTVSRQSTSFTHTITYKCGSTSGTVCTKSSSTSISWTPPLSLAQQNTTGTSVSITFTITTYNGSTDIGSNTKSISCTIPSSVKPSCTVSVTDSTGFDSTYGNPVKGLSKFKVVVTPTTAQGSAIASYKTTANGDTYTSASFTTGVLNSSGTVTVSATVTDKRGRSGSASVSKTVLNYAPPTISKLSVKRCDEDGTANDQGEWVYVNFNATTTNLNDLNKPTYVLKYKRSSDANYTEISLDDYNGLYTVTDGMAKFEADSGSSYKVEFSVTDSHNTSSKTTTVSTAFTLMNWNAAGNGMAIGKVSEKQNLFDIGLATRFYGGIEHMLLEPETDLNDVRVPNTYIGEDISRNSYGNCPLTSGTFTLIVEGMGDSGQVRQTIIYCHKTDSRTWERIYYASAWGEWICTSDYGGKLLWSGGWTMNQHQTITLTEPVSKQRSGITLVFGDYTTWTVKDDYFQTFFIPKYQILKHAGCGYTFMLAPGGTFSTFASKYLHINNDTIVGNAVNSTAGTGACGIKYDNSSFLLRYVIGV